MVIDTLCFSTQQDIDLSVLKRMPGTGTKISRPLGYNYRRVFNLPNDVNVVVSKDPIFGNCKSAVQMNLENFKSWKQFVIFLEQIFPQIDLEALIIRRVDQFLDLPLTIDFFRKHLYVLRKRKNDRIVSNSTTITFGKGLHRISIYDKARESKMPAPFILARVEVQHRGSAAPFLRFADVERLRAYHPFRNFVFYKYVGGPNNIISKGLNESLRDCGSLFEFVRTVVKWSRFRNLVKTGYFQVLSEPNLSEIYSERLHRFLDGDEGEDYFELLYDHFYDHSRSSELSM